MNTTPARGLLAALLLSASTAALADSHDISCASGPAANASRTDDFSLKAPLRVTGLTADGQLVCFSDRKPGKARTIGTVSGFDGSDTRLIGIDFRPQDGLLYGVGDAGGLYRVNTDSAALELVGRLKTAPAGTAFGVDFNPAANALRIVSNTGQNLRQSFGNLGTGNPLADTAVDGTLAYPPVPPAMATTAMGVVAAAYTNNDVNAATATTLFVLDSNLKQIAVQSPANAGTLVATGALGVNPSAGGLDIYSVLRADVTVAQRALASLVVEGTAGLYDVDVLTGKASPRGAFNTLVVDIAIPRNQY